MTTLSKDEVVRWQVVPVEPTQEMIAAVCNCHDVDHIADIISNYKAMLAAAFNAHPNLDLDIEAAMKRGEV